MNIRTASGLLAAAVLAACAKKDAAPAAGDSAAADTAAATSSSSATSTGAEPNVVTVTAKDFSFDAPQQVPAGATTIRLVNGGKTLHHVQIVRLDSGKTMQDFQAAMKNTNGPPPKWITFGGGPNAVAPGDSSNASVNLAPGQYVLLCFVDTPDHVPHVAKGMARPMTVTAASATPATAATPAPDITVRLVDYDFQFSQPLTAGKHTIRVQNDAAQVHEIQLIQLAPGKTMKDLMAWAKTYKGPPPGKPTGGVSGLGAGAEATFTTDLPAGDYALLCFYPDAKDGKPHLAHGMAKQIKVS